MDVSYNTIDQSKAELIGHQAFYKDGSNKFYELAYPLESIDRGTISNPLVKIQQVGMGFRKSEGSYIPYGQGK